MYRFAFAAGLYIGLGLVAPTCTALRGETYVSQQTSQTVEGVRMVAIDDGPDEDEK